jgi:S-adenosylmethionine synthetase
MLAVGISIISRIIQPDNMKVIITGKRHVPHSWTSLTPPPGASGVLGRAATKYFHSQNDTVIPLSFTRTTQPDSSLPPYQKLDLLDFDATREFFRAQGKVDVIVHCAAERRPDVAEQDPERAEKLNKDVVAVLVEIAEELECLMIYVSTDYVFDGKK